MGSHHPKGHTFGRPTECAQEYAVVNNDTMRRWLDPRRSFTARLALIMVLLVILGLAGATYVTMVMVRASLTSQIGEGFEAQAMSLGDAVGVFFKERVGQLQVLASSGVVQDAVAERNAAYAGSSDDILAAIDALDERWVVAADDDPFILSIISDDPAANRAASRLAGFLRDFQYHTEVFVTDRYGATVAATGRLSDYYQADEGWWLGGWNEGMGAVYISGPEFDESAGVTALLVAVPVVDDETGEVIGVLRSTVNVNELLDLITAVSFGQTGQAMLVDRSGAVLIEAHVEGAKVRLSWLPTCGEHWSEEYQAPE
jgi:hypothetical protein